MTPFDTAISKLNIIYCSEGVNDGRVRVVLEALITAELHEFVEKLERQQTAIKSLKERQP